MSIKHDAPLNKDDLLAIENVLYEPKEDELVARTAVQVNTNFPPFASEIGYDWYTRKGSARIIAAGGSAKDIPFVGEDGGRETAKVYAIATGIRFTKAERMASQAKASLGKGPSVSLDTSRVKAARRFVAETENRLFFTGDAGFGIKGILNKSGVIAENVATTGTGSTDILKRQFVNKAPSAILDDLLAAKTKVEGAGLFKARVLMIPPMQRLRMLKPYSDNSPMTVLRWLESEGMYFEKIIETRALLAAHNGLGVDAFCLFDNDPEVIELAVIEDITLGEPIYDIIGTSEQAVTEMTAGAIIRHPSAIYIGKGI